MKKKILRDIGIPPGFSVIFTKGNNFHDLMINESLPNGSIPNKKDLPVVIISFNSKIPLKKGAK